MKQTFDFEQFTPPVLNENILRRELEKRTERRRTVLLAVAGALFEAVFILLGLLCWNTAPALTLAGIGLAEDQVVGVAARVEAAPDGQLHGDGAAALEPEGAVVVLHHDRAVDVLHPGQAAGGIGVEVGLHRVAPAGVVLGVDVAGDGGLVRRPGRRNQAEGHCQAQRPTQDPPQGQETLLLH